MNKLDQAIYDIANQEDPRGQLDWLRTRAHQTSLGRRDRCRSGFAAARISRHSSPHT